MFEKLKKKGFQVLALHHAEAILKHDMADAVTELEQVLLDVQIPVEELIRGGGGEGELTQRMRHMERWDQVLSFAPSARSSHVQPSRCILQSHIPGSSTTPRLLVS